MRWRTTGELITDMSHRWLAPFTPVRITQTSTAVIQAFESPGKIEALPNGSGILATKMSPLLRKVQPSLSAVSRVRNLRDRSRKNPSPMSASWIRRTSPDGPDLYSRSNRHQQTHRHYRPSLLSWLHPIQPATSLHQHLIQFLQNRLQLLPEHLIRLAQPTALDEGFVLEVLGFDSQAGGDVVANGFQPLPLLGSELAAARFLLCHPGGEVFVDLVAEGMQVALLVHGKAHQRNQVGEDTLSRTAHSRTVKRLICLPQAIGGPGTRRTLDGFGQL